ncbi:MAG: ABC transporter permease subunit [Candidatus Limnocylindrales bacterium]
MTPPPEAVAAGPVPGPGDPASGAHVTPVAVPPIPTGGGWRIIAAKEFADHINSVRFLLLTLGLGLAAVASVAAASGGIRSVAPDATGSPAIFLKLFTISSNNLPAFVDWIAFLGPLLGIAFGFDAVNNERTERTLPRLLSGPIWRDDVVNGKFAGALAAIGLILAAIVVVVAGVGIFQLGVVPQPEDILRLLVWYLVAIVYIGFWLALATLCSVVLRRAAGSALAALSVWLIAAAFSTFLVGTVADVLAPLPSDATFDQQLANAQMQQDLQHLFPGNVFNESTEAILDPSVRTTGIVISTQVDRAVPSVLTFDQSLLVVWAQVAGLVALTAVCFGLAYWVFMNQEVRA